MGSQPSQGQALGGASGHRIWESLLFPCLPTHRGLTSGLLNTSREVVVEVSGLRVAVQGEQVAKGSVGQEHGHILGRRGRMEGPPLLLHTPPLRWKD